MLQQYTTQEARSIFKRVLKLINRNTCSTSILRRWNNPPQNIFLKITTVKKLLKQYEHILVIKPQGYDKISKLKKTELEYFYDGGKGVAVTGTGADQWRVVSDKSVEFFRKIEKACKKDQISRPTNVSRRKSQPRKKRGCVEQTIAKYQNRKSPPYPANECPLGKILQGNPDYGLSYWITAENAKGIQQWRRM